LIILFIYLYAFPYKTTSHIKIELLEIYSQIVMSACCKRGAFLYSCFLSQDENDIVAH